MTVSRKRTGRIYSRAFTLVEVLISIVIFGATFLALYAGISNGFGIIKASRENLRASQIITERFEAIRLYNWTNLVSGTTNMTWTNTSEYYDFANTNGTLYNVAIEIGSGPGEVAYSNSLKLVLITV